MTKWPIRYIYVLSVPYMAALTSLAGLKIGGLRYTGFLWLIILYLGILLILLHRGPIPFPWKIWAPWFGYIWLSFFWSGIDSRSNLQYPLQMTTPLIIGIVASFSVETEAQLDRLYRGFIHCILFIAIVFVIFWYGPGVPYQEFGFGYSVRTAAQTQVLVAGIFIARKPIAPTFSVLGWTFCLAICFFSGSRVATFILIFLWCVAPIYKSFGRQILVMGMMFIFALGLLNTPTFQERFFGEIGIEKGGIKQIFSGEISGSGRFYIWPQVWEKAQDNLIFGAGAGEEAKINIVLLNGQIQPTLNDYLRILYEYGIVGLSLFLYAVIRQVCALRKRRRFTDKSHQWVGNAAILGFFALMIFNSTEQMMIYGLWFLHPLFLLIGVAYGLKIKRLNEKEKGYIENPQCNYFIPFSR